MFIDSCVYTTKYRIAYLVVFVKPGIAQDIATSLWSEALVELSQRVNSRLAGS